MVQNYLTALPVFNEAKYVDGVLDEARRYSENVLVVDDGSTDGTADLLAARDDIRVVTHDENRGYGAALRSGLRAARGELVFFSDADLQFDLAEIEGENYRPQLHTDAARRTAEFLVELSEFAHKESMVCNWDRRIGIFSRGEAAMTYGWSIRAAAFEAQ